MKDRIGQEERFETNLFCRLVAFFCLCTPLAVLSGWYLNNKLLKTWDLIGPSMNPLTALLLFLCGVCLFLFQTNNRKWVFIISWSILIVTIANLISNFTSYHIDHVLFPDRVMHEYPYNHVAFPTTVSLCIISTAFICLADGRYKAGQLLSVIVFFISLFVFIAYLYGERPLYFLPGRMAMALNTSLSFLLLSLGTAMCFKSKGYVPHILGEQTGAKVAKRFIPLGLLFIVFIGWLRLEFLHTGYLTIEAGLALLIAITFMTFLLLVYRFSVKISMAELNLEKEKK
jgi:hypothetical protein